MIQVYGGATEQNGLGRLNARVMETAGKAFYGGMESACNGNSV